MSCGAKFYDLARDPAVCPKCGTVFQQTASSRIAAPVVARSAPKEEEDEPEDKAGPEMVSLDEVEAEEDQADTTPDDDSSDDADATDDDTFLEEEDAGDDDVADLIDGDIENDEET
ncbi:hypothetical protein MPOCJGCO_2931 [Methylobacterium trifolii]|uniref:TIGR02300 family protein n=2 Tax=Methylobacterium trifolii TaxID=1003092 RepID=A0ABQ4U1G6_9HYPH|nr:hypothetical protein MPOCJGCO_2931 [Methylobacterium trifolii]